MSKRSGQVLPFTLTELFVLLFFALALALAREVRERREAQRVAGEAEEIIETLRPLGPDGVQEIVRIIEQGSEQFPDDFTELVRRLEQHAAVREELVSLLVEAGHDRDELRELSASALASMVRELHQGIRAEADVLREIANLSDEDRSILQQLTEQIAGLDRENRDLRGRIVNLVARIGNGLDHPPCWADATGRIEYAFEATLRTSSIDLRPIWPSRRDADAARIPGMREASGRGMSYGDFTERAQPIFTWSRQQQPECRHFVVIVDSVAGGKDAFKNGLLTTERFFYKLLTN